MVSRAYRRVRMRFPVRLRWTSPFGQKIELAETVDVSSGGLLLTNMGLHAPGVPLWVTFPYDTWLREGQPEVPARVVRGEESSTAPMHFPLAIQSLGQARSACNWNGVRRDPERRGSPRRLVVLPIRVRLENVPWFEEAMSLDVFSGRNVLSRSARIRHRRAVENRVGRASSASWPDSGEFRAKVVRVAPGPDGVAVDVGVCRAT